MKIRNIAVLISLASMPSLALAEIADISNVANMRGAVVSAAASSNYKSSSDVEFKTLKKKVAELEERLGDTEGDVSEASSELNDIMNKRSFEMGGYVTTEYHMRNSINKKNTNKDSFALKNLSLFMSKKGMVNGKMDMFAELEFQGGVEIGGAGSAVGSINGNIALEQAYIDWHINNDRSLDIRVGRMLTKFGIWNEDHYFPWVETQSTPQMLKTLFPFAIDGAAVFGQKLFGDKLINYAVYMGNGGVLGGQSSPATSNNDGNMQYGGNIGVASKSGDLDWKVGASFYSEKISNNALTKVIKMNTIGLDTKLDFNAWHMKAEIAMAKNKDLITNKSYTTTAGYGQISYDVSKKWLAGYRYDYYNDKHPTGNGVGKAGRNVMNIPFVNYKLGDNARLKFEYVQNSKVNRANDEAVLALSVGF